MKTNSTPSKLPKMAYLNKILEWRLSAFLLLCLVLGGTSQALFSLKLPVYLLSLLMIGVALSLPMRRPFQSLFSLPFYVLILFFIGNIIYLIPLPVSLWTALPGRDIVVKGFDVLGASPPWLPISLTPEKTQISLLAFLPVIAIWLTVTISASKKEIKNTFASILFFGAFSVFLGFLQLTIDDAFYIYDVTHIGSLTGFFANSNHQAIFLVMILPFALYFTLKTSKYEGREALKRRTVGLSLIILFLVGIMLTRSIAGYILSGVTIALSLYTLRTVSFLDLKKLTAISAVFFFIVALDFVYLGQFTPEFVNELEAADGTSRQVMFSTTLEAAKTYFPFGSGPGSFQEVYQLHEDRDLLWRKYANQAHNEYVQLFLEFGILGGIIIALVCLCFFRRLIKLKLSVSSITLLASPLTLISILALTLHSIVDYPIRTIAIASLATFLVASLVRKQNT